MMMLWPIVIFALKLLLVVAMALLIAVSLWTLDHALRHGAVFETKPGPIRTRAQTPLRYWFYIVNQVPFVLAGAVMIRVVIHLGDGHGPPATNTREERPASPALPNDESYDRADVGKGRNSLGARASRVRAPAPA